MHTAPCDHVRGDLIAPALDWLGQLVAERRRSFASVEALWPRGERALLLERPDASRWVPVSAGRRLVEAIVEVHGGAMAAVLRELGRRSVPAIAALDGAPADRLALRLDGLIRLGHWRPSRLALPGDLLELEARRPCAPSLLAWVSGLLASAVAPHGAERVAPRIEAPTRVVFVRCRA